MADPSLIFQMALEHHKAGRLAEAESGYWTVLGENPQHAPALHLLGLLTLGTGEPAKAIELLSQSMQLDRNQPLLHLNLAEAYERLGDHQRAIDCCREALTMRPDLVEAHFLLGQTLREIGKLTEAAQALHRTVELRPAHAQAWDELACVCYEQMRFAEAETAARQALAIDPNFLAAYNTLAVVLNDAARTDEAVEVCKQALALDPECPALHANLASGLQAQGRGEDAIAARRKSLRLFPADARQHSNLLYILNMSPTQTSSTIHAEHLAWGARHAEALTAAAAAHPVDRDPARRLRVGYVSPFFRRHAVNYFIEPVLLNHDHQQFEIYCYSDLQAGDDVTDRLQSAADVWRPIAFQPDAEVAAQIRQDQIDILVDLPGHIGGNRLLVFARKPAPIQVTYLGYQNTTGMRAMDYRLTDARADPPGVTDAYYTEQLVRLPRAFFCYQPEDEGLEVSPLPALKRGYLTFGSFNNYIKVTPQTVAAWLEILKRVADSRLLVLAYRDGYVERSLREQAQAAGVDPARIEVVDKRAHRPYMELLGTADIGLDPFPFNGHTTTCDSVWMGVPVVMLEGTSYASRFGGSVLANVGLEDWIASSVEGYIETASYWAGELAQLAHLRGVLRARMASSALLDYAGFTRQLETAYRQMWQTRCTS